MSLGVTSLSRHVLLMLKSGTHLCLRIDYRETTTLSSRLSSPMASSTASQTPDAYCSFNPSLNSWNVLPGRPPKRPRSNGCFMTEHQGEIFLIYMYSHMKPTVLKLGLTSFEWTERKTLGGLTIYASALSSESRAKQQKPSGIRNCLCLSVFHGFKRICINHKVDEESKKLLQVEKHDPYENIWIMPPLNLPLFNQLLLQ